MKNYRGFKYPETMEELKNQPGDVDPEIVYVYLGGLTPVRILYDFLQFGHILLPIVLLSAKS